MASKPKESPMRRMLNSHKLGCTIRVHSDGPKRHCSCGRDEAEKELENLEKIASLLKQLEWVKGGYPEPDRFYCPDCGNDRISGHNSDCRVAEVMALVTTKESPLENQEKRE